MVRKFIIETLFNVEYDENYDYSTTIKGYYEDPQEIWDDLKDTLVLYGKLAKAFEWSKDLTPCLANLTNTYWPFVILSITGLGFKNGLYIFIMRQYYQGVPDELEEAAYVDGSGVFKTFIRIIVPLSVPMLITIFLFAFS